jgi:hypothetical protein
MAVTEAVSTSGRFKTYSSSNATLATALSEVANALDANGVTQSQMNCSLTHNGTVYSYVVLVKLR